MIKALKRLLALKETQKHRGSCSYCTPSPHDCGAAGGCGVGRMFGSAPIDTPLPLTPRALPIAPHALHLATSPAHHTPVPQQRFYAQCCLASMQETTSSMPKWEGFLVGFGGCVGGVGGRGLGEERVGKMSTPTAPAKLQQACCTFTHARGHCRSDGSLLQQHPCHVGVFLHWHFLHSGC